MHFLQESMPKFESLTSFLDSSLCGFSLRMIPSPHSHISDFECFSLSVLPETLISSRRVVTAGCKAR
jgi:hypothetical protein